MQVSKSAWEMDQEIPGWKRQDGLSKRKVEEGIDVGMRGMRFNLGNERVSWTWFNLGNERVS